MGSVEGGNPLLLSSPEQNDFQEESTKDNDLINKTWTESKKLWQIAGPSIFSRLSMFSMTIITQAFAGHLGDLNLAAISIVTTVIISICFGFLLGMASALETLCGQAYGAKQYHMLGLYMQRSWIVLFICSILLIPMFVFASPFLKLIGQSTTLAEQTGIVAVWLIPLHLSFPFQFTLQRFLQCQLKTAVIAWVSGVALLVHVIVSWVFVYKLRVGIVGTAITLDFSWWLSVLGLFCYSVCGGCPQSWTGFSNQAFVGLWEFLKLSVASGVMLSLENFYYRVLIIVSGYMRNSEVAVDALSICIAIYAWESMVPLGFLAATGVRVANELGAGNANGAKFATIVSLLYSLLVGLFFWSVVMAIPGKLAMIFTSTSAVITMVNELALLLACTILLNCIQPVLSGAAIGSGWQALVALINIGSYYLVGVPLGVLLGWLLQFNIKGIWAGMICGTVVQTLILTIITIKLNWEKEAEKARIHMYDEAASYR
ncbi:protein DETOXIFICATION 27-like isoform X1 [Mangifera indica]|uniref:protein DETOXIFICATION 27-like isoform X1 n=2 Tax=Mangifera indica TaxID=29780 RepID=UPI001CF98405|nr:protein DETOXIFICATION 27-like isoform X1 [Mangifera indica]